MVEHWSEKPGVAGSIPALGILRRRSPRTPAVLPYALALAAASCASPRPGPPSPPPVIPRAPRGLSPCFNTQYGFTCSVPKGFVITEEHEGPGAVMKLVERVLGSRGAANLTVKTAPYRGGPVIQAVRAQILDELHAAKSEGGWKLAEASYGRYTGIEVILERRYVSGPYRSRIFGFTRGRTLFLLELASPSEHAGRDREVLAAFIESLTFR